MPSRCSWAWVLLKKTIPLVKWCFCILQPPLFLPLPWVCITNSSDFWQRNKGDQPQSVRKLINHNNQLRSQFALLQTEYPFSIISFMSSLSKTTMSWPPTVLMSYTISLLQYITNTKVQASSSTDRYPCPLSSPLSSWSMFSFSFSRKLWKILRARTQTSKFCDPQTHLCSWKWFWI